VVGADDGLGRTLKLVVAYDGRRFAGSQRQAGTRTIQEELETACRRLFGCDSPVRLAGRTDVGVHAIGQVAAVRVPDSGPPDGAVLDALNALLPDDVALRKVEVEAGSFDPRRDARWREYRYRIAVGVVSPLLFGLVLSRRQALDRDAMRQAALRFEGEHDFAAFAGMGAGTPWSAWRERPRQTVRRIYRCDCRPAADLLFGGGDGIVEVVVTGDAFLPRQVRAMVGALIEVGRGRREPDWIDELLASRDRRAGPETVPGHGLVLWEVGYAPFGEGPPPSEAKKEADGSSHVHTEDRGHQA
jgi:tRNA pseudouridine38-40 synthase